ncbi:MAG TPA: hypothetical protein VFZ66_03810 [Herpetosiphonaceae bacterium]
MLLKVSSNLTDQDIDRFVELVISEGITLEEMRDFQNRLSKQQKQIADNLFLEKVPQRQHISIDPTQHLVDKAEEVPLGDVSTTASCDPGAVPNCWQQNIEEIYIPPSGSYYGAFTEGWYTTTTTCDKEDDTDYVFAGRRDAINPDKLRWTSTSTQVTYAIELINGTNINSYGLNLYEVRMCLGDNTVSYAGGPDKVRASLYTYYIP